MRYAITMEELSGAPIISFANTSAWETWLAEHYELQTGLWIKIARASSGIPTATRPQALDVALCYGWIDGQSRSLDGTYYLQKYTPRRPRSLWSKVNIGKVEQLIAEGRMQPSGFAAIEGAKVDGRWDAAYEPQRLATPPEDFLEALKPYPDAKAFYDSLSRASQYAFLWRLMTAKKPETRAKRLAAMVEMLKESKQFN